MKTHNSLPRIILLMCVVLVTAPGAATAQLQSPVPSPYAMVSEQVGITNIVVKYCRPGVNGREIWGDIVPHGFDDPIPGFGNGDPIPWRAGANENTTIWFEHDMRIEDQVLPAGTYGLHMIPGEGDWVVIFSGNSTSWGSYFYEQSEDVLRVTVTPEEAPFKERLLYEFTDHEGPGSVTLALLWENLKVPIDLEVDQQHEVVLASMRNELRSRGGFSWQGWAQAANYCLQNNINLDEAENWADRAISRNATFNTVDLKASILSKQGNITESDSVMEEVIPSASAGELNQYGYRLLGENRPEKAMEIFKLNVKRHPDSWNPFDSLAEAYARQGDVKNAQKFYKAALSKLSPEDVANRDRISKILTDFQTGG